MVHAIPNEHTKEINNIFKHKWKEDMKYRYLIAAILGLSACTLETPEAITQSAASPSDVGIDFESMPLGTEAHYRSNRGDTWIRRYTGTQGRFYVVENIFKGRVNYTLYYNSDGTLYRREYANGNVRTFSPRRCMRVLGDCFFTTTITQPRNSMESKGNLTKSSNTYTYRYGAADGSSLDTFSYRLGQFNLVSYGKSGDFTERLVRVVMP